MGIESGASGTYKKLISWNVNGLRACVKKGFLDFLRAESPDVLCLQETKMQEWQEEIPTPGYHRYWCSAEKKGYSGTLMLTKEEPISVTTGLGIEEHDREGRVITAEFDDFYLVTVYTPNSQNELARLPYRMKWEDAFREYLKGLERGENHAAPYKENQSGAGDGDDHARRAQSEEDAKDKEGSICADNTNAGGTGEKSACAAKPVIVCGDMNVAHEEIDLKNPKTNHKNAGFTDEERGKMTQLLGAGFIDTFRYFYPDAEGIYSWWSYRFNARANNAGWRIDYFLASEALAPRLYDAKILTDVYGSDHCPVVLELC